MSRSQWSIEKNKHFLDDKARDSSIENAKTVSDVKAIIHKCLIAAHEIQHEKIQNLKEWINDDWKKDHEIDRAEIKKVETRRGIRERIRILADSLLLENQEEKIISILNEILKDIPTWKTDTFTIFKTAGASRIEELCNKAIEKIKKLANLSKPTIVISKEERKKARDELLESLQPETKKPFKR